jgi:multicomponent Na+:H+ antiporter subunit C
MHIFPFVVVVYILAVGLYGIVTSRHLVHQIMCLIVVQSSTYVLLLGIGYKTGAVAPYFYDIPVHTPAVDPVVQALAVTALLLAFAIQAQKRFGTLDPQELVQLKG